MKISKKTKRIFGLIIYCIGFLASLLIVIDEWFNSHVVDGKFLFFSFFFLHFILKYFTWGRIYENEEEDDELDKHIQAQSSKISYYILMVSSIAILYFFSDSKNYPLIVTVGLILITLPLTEFFYSKKYK